jgi:geranylgeranyl pyrophosphate synthase
MQKALHMAHLLEAQNGNPPPISSATWLKWRYGHLQQHVNQWLEDALQTAWLPQGKALQDLPETEASLKRLWQASRHATLLGGKRIRPLLSVLVWQALSRNDVETLKGICLSSEFMHAQSLVFDDLPCMDDDNLRRGKPTTHIAFDEATAVLVGDALVSFAFECLIKYSPQNSKEAVEALLKITQCLGELGSFNGLVNGQYADMWSHESPPSLEQLRYIHAHKTGALLRYAIVTPAILVGASMQVQEGLATWADLIGQLFQATDDLLDATASSDDLGKTAGKDADQNKLTYLRVLGIEGTQSEVNRLQEEGWHALKRLKQWGLQTEALSEIQDFIVHRRH